MSALSIVFSIFGIVVAFIVGFIFGELQGQINAVREQNHHQGAGND